MNINKSLALFITLIVDFILLMLGAGCIAFLNTGGIFIFLIEFYFIRFIHRSVFAFLTKDNSINQELSHNHIEEEYMISHKEIDFITPSNFKANIENYEDSHPKEIHKKKCFIKRNTVRSIFIVSSILLGAIFIAFILWNKTYSENKISGYLYPICENGLYGYIDSVGNRIIEPQYLWCSTFSNDRALVVVDTIFKEVDDSISYLVGETDSVEKRYRMFAKYGYINRSGDFVLAPNYICFVNMANDSTDSNISTCDHVFQLFTFRNDRALAFDTTTWKVGYINKVGEIIIPQKYCHGKPFRDGVAIVYDMCGKPIYTNGVLISRSKLRCAYINKNGEPLTEFKYQTLTSFSNNRGIGTFIEVNKDNEYGIETYQRHNILIDENGNTIDTLSFLYKYYDYSSDGIVAAEPEPMYWFFNKSCCFVDKKGKILAPLEHLSDARAAYLSKRNDIMQACPMDVSLKDITYFNDGLAGITSDGEHWFFVDKDFIIHGYGKESVYDKVSGFGNGLCAVKKNGKWGFVNNKIKEVIRCKYDSCGSPYPYLEEAYDLKINGSIEKKYWINRFDSIVWESKSNEKISNVYSNKNKGNWGKWIYVSSNKKFKLDNRLLWTIATIISIIIIIILIVKLYPINKSNGYVKFNRRIITISLSFIGVVILCISLHYILSYLLHDYSYISESNIKESKNFIRRKSIRSNLIRYEEERFRAKDSIGVKPQNTKWLKFGIGTLPSGKYISTYVGTAKDSYFAGYETVTKYYSRRVPRYKTINYGYGIKDTYQDGWDIKKEPYTDYIPIYYDYSWQYAISSFDISGKLSLFCNEDSVYSNYLKEIEKQLTSNYGYKFLYTKIDGKKALRYTTYDGTPIKRVIFCANGRAFVMETKSIGSLNEHSEKACSKIILRNFNIEEKDNKCMLISIICLLFGAILLISTLIWHNYGFNVVNNKAHKLLRWSIISAFLNIALFLYATYSMYVDFTVSEILAYIQILGILSFIFISVPLIYYYSSAEKSNRSDTWLVPGFLYKHIYSRIKTIVNRRLFLTFVIYPIMILALLPCGLLISAYIIPVLIISEIFILLSRWFDWLRKSNLSDNIVEEDTKGNIIMKITYILLAIALLLCLAPLPYDYYIFIRYITMVVFVIIAYRHYKRNRLIWCIIFASIALLFQPFLKMEIGRMMWNIVDVVVAVLLIGLFFVEQNEENNTGKKDVV